MRDVRFLSVSLLETLSTVGVLLTALPCFAVFRALRVGVLLTALPCFAVFRALRIANSSAMFCGVQSPTCRRIANSCHVLRCSEPYVVTGNFSVDFSELCVRGGVGAVPVVARAHRPITPPPQPVAEEKTRGGGKKDDRRIQVVDLDPEPELTENGGGRGSCQPGIFFLDKAISGKKN